MKTRTSRGSIRVWPAFQVRQLDWTLEKIAGACDRSSVSCAVRIGQTRKTAAAAMPKITRYDSQIAAVSGRPRPFSQRTGRRKNATTGATMYAKRTESASRRATARTR